MRKEKQYGIICFLLFGLLLLPQVVSAQEIEIEELEAIYMEEQVIVTAAKRAQRISESPSAISVVTAEDIKQLGAVNLTEALIMTQGVHFGYTHASQAITGGIRGFHRLPSNKIMFLIDGAPTMFEVFQIPSFSPLPVALDEIERIEVLRGPGSSLYGANAITGVINAITKKTEDTHGSLLSLKAGEFTNIGNDYIHGGAIEDVINYRYSIGWHEMENWGPLPETTDPVGKTARINTTIDYTIDDNSNLNLMGSYIDLRRLFYFSGQTQFFDFEDSDYYQTAITYTSDEPNLMVRGIFTERDLMESGLLRDPITGTFPNWLRLKMGMKEVSVQQTLEPVENDVLTWGANYTQLTTQGPIVGSITYTAPNPFPTVSEGKRRHDMRGLFVDNTYRFTDEFSLNAGLRHDHHPNTGDTLSHRLSALYSPDEENNYRFTWATSFRNPDFVENYLNLPGSTPTCITWTCQVLMGMGLITSQPIIQQGMQDVEPEKAETFEFGYRGKDVVVEKLDLEANLFYTKLMDPIQTTWDGTSFDQQLSAILGAANLVPILRYGNYDDVEQLGAEIELKYPLTDWLTGMFNYTYMEMWEDKGQLTADGELLEIVSATPQHMLNLQLRGKWDNGVSANLAIFYRGTMDWGTSSTTIGTNDVTTISEGKAKDHTTVNLRVGKEFQLLNNDAEIGLAVWNLLDDNYNDYPLSSAPIGRRVVGTFTYKW